MGKKRPDWGDKQVPIINYKGSFNWGELYSLIRIWLQERNYKYWETKYKHKPDEIKLEAEGRRKVDDFYRNFIYIKILIHGYKEEEIIQDGRKVKIVTGRMMIRLQHDIEQDWSNQFQGSPFKKKLLEWTLRVRNKEFEAMHLEPHSYQVYELHNRIKTFLNMSTTTYSHITWA